MNAPFTDESIARTEEQDYIDEMRERGYPGQLPPEQGDETMDVRELYTEGALITLESLPDRRNELVDYIAALAVAEDTLAIVQAKAETQIAEAAGGEKGLGSNTDARKRALTVSLGTHDLYVAALHTARSLRRSVKESEMLVRNERDTLGLIKAALYASSGAFPA